MYDSNMKLRNLEHLVKEAWKEYARMEGLWSILVELQTS